ncbi:MAG: TetR/AcrR family transcriptional regulator [Mycobacteriaceae bacterium]
MTRYTLMERRTQLIDAAVRVIVKRGVARASARVIAAEAGVSLGSVHYAFESREALLAAVIESVTQKERIAAEVLTNEFGADAVPTIKKLLTRGMEAYVHLLESDPSSELALLDLFVHSLRNGSHYELRNKQYETYYSFAAQLLSSMAERARCRWDMPVNAIARMLVAMLDGLTTTWLADRDTTSAMQLAHFYIEMLDSFSSPNIL